MFAAVGPILRLAQRYRVLYRELMASTTSPESAPRVCACVLMNHPFPAILPLLRKIYADRFSEVRFLIPFERMPEEKDVITVYRGSYNHASYLTDAYSELSKIDCDYFMIVHDDVLLNPALDESTFSKTFRLGPNDGFICEYGSLYDTMGEWIWNFALLPRLLFPKSLLFGSGVEYANLKKYLPPRELLEAKLAAAGARASSKVRFDPNTMTGIEGVAEHSLFHGLSHPQTDGSAARQALQGESFEIQKALVAAMSAAWAGSGSGGPDAIIGEAEFPIPLVSSGFFADFYILPKSGLADFAHYIGVAGAANLFVEVLAPTLLQACCERVRWAGELGLDFSGFREPKSLDWFADPNAVAIHPYKLSTHREPAAQERLLDALEMVADQARRHVQLTAATVNRGVGWHPVESWGFWAAEARAVVRVPMDATGAVRLKLRPPTHPEGPTLMGRVHATDINGACVGEVHTLSAQWPVKEVELVVANVSPDSDGFGRIMVHTDVMTHPARYGAADPRQLGFGLAEVEAA